MAPRPHVDALLLDIDGVLVTSWRALPGAVEAVEALRRQGTPFMMITNTTTHTRAGLAATLREAGFDLEAQRIAVVDADPELQTGARAIGDLPW